MADLKFRITRNDLEKLKSKIKDTAKAIDRATANKIGQAVVSGMKDLVSKGISPIQGKGRFPAYKNPEKYPGKLKGKRPVNLQLSGDFLASLKFQTVKSGTGYSTEVGFFNRESELIEEGHREGVNEQPKRPIIPDDNSGEKISTQIQNEIEDIYRERIEEVLKEEL